MRHHLKTIAQNFNLDEKRFTEFAVNNSDKYSICLDEPEYYTVSTLFADDLVQDFKKSMTA